MPTESSGDGRTDAAGAVEPGVTAEGTDPAATVPDEQEAARAAEPTAQGTAEPTAQGTAEPTAQGAEAPSARSAPGPADAGAAEAEASAAGEVAPDDAEAADEAVHAVEDGESDETADSAGADAEHPDAEHPDAEHPDAEHPDEVAAGYEDHGDGEELRHDGDYTEYDYTEYSEHEHEETAEPRRARRWHRMLLALGFAALAAAIVGGAIAIVGSVTHGFKKPVKITYKNSALFSLKTGDCFDPQGQSYTLIPCDSPHDAEVFATFTLTGTKWPGATVVAKEASHGCASRLTGYLNPQLAISLSSTYVYPDSVAWQAGTKTVICEVRAKSGQITGSVRGASATAG